MTGTGGKRAFAATARIQHWLPRSGHWASLRLGQAAAEACGQETPFGAEAARRFGEFAEAGGSDLDFSAIYRTIRRENT